MKKIELIPYDIKWPAQYKKITTQIKQALAYNFVYIHHVGSTSVPGLASKDKIDICLRVKDAELAIKSLTKIDFEYSGEWNIPFKYGFRYRKNIRINLHMFDFDHPAIESNLLFRNYLRKNVEYKTLYSRLKYDILNDDDSHKKSGPWLYNYTLRKSYFIKDIISKTGFSKTYIQFCTDDQEWQEYHRIRKKEIFDTIVNLTYNPNHPTMSDPSHKHIVLYKGTEIIGIAQIECKNEEYYILRSIAIDQKHQSQGYGKQLLKLIEKWIKQRGIKKIYLHTDNTAVDFYYKLGYQKMNFTDNDGVNLANKIDLGKIL